MSFQNSTSQKLNPVSPTRGLCGPASLQIVFSRFGINASLEEISKLASATKKDGTSLEGITRATKHFGFQVFCKDDSAIEDLVYFVNLGLLPIVDWFDRNEGHYSVFLGLEKGKVLLCDSGSGVSNKKTRRISKKDFLRNWFDFPGDYIKTHQDLLLRRMIVVAPSEMSLSFLSLRR